LSGRFFGKLSPLENELSVDHHVRDTFGKPMGILPPRSVGRERPRVLRERTELGDLRSDVGVHSGEVDVRGVAMAPVEPQRFVRIDAEFRGRDSRRDVRMSFASISGLRRRATLDLRPRLPGQGVQRPELGIQCTAVKDRARRVVTPALLPRALDGLPREHLGHETRAS